MPLATTKPELLEKLNQAYNKLDSEFERVSCEQERILGIEGGISCCDVLAYQIGWTNLLLGWDRQECSGKQPILPAENYQWNQLSALAQSFYREHAQKSLSQLRVEFHDCYHELIRWIEPLSEQELFALNQRQWAGEKWPLVKWIQVNTIAPYGSARTRIRRGKREISQ